MNLRQLVERVDRPFATQPQVARYFPAASIEDARKRLARSVERGDGPGVVIGGAGTGKSLLLQVLAAQYREQFDVVLLACAQLCTRRALLQAIHFELGLDYRRRDEGTLRLSLLDTLLSGDEATQGLLLLVDEAQALAVHLLEELRVLTNLSRGGAPRVRLVLAGLPALEEKLASPELQSFSQRLAARCYLAPLTRAETAQYVRAQLAASQIAADRLFAPAALDAIYTATDGVPRLVNQLCDRALVDAASKQRESIDATMIQAAWADLQQLPSSWGQPAAASPAASGAASVVEFGALTEEASVVPSSPVAREAEASQITADISSAPPATAATTSPIAVPSLDLPVSRPAPQHHPRVFSEHSTETIDPFAEEFEEEELVLDSFVTLANIFGKRMPRVENRREPGLSQLVEQALAAPPANPAVPADFDASEPAATPLDEVPTRPALRLAVVSDAPPAAALVNNAGERFAPQHECAAAVCEPADDELAEAILVIEDEPAELVPPPSGVRRESYRQLFSRLRRAT